MPAEVRAPQPTLAHNHQTSPSDVDEDRSYTAIAKIPKFIDVASFIASPLCVFANMAEKETRDG